MITVQQAKELLSRHQEKGQKLILPLGESLGYVLARDVVSPIAVPSFDNSAMDGYALKFDGRRSWSLQGSIQAGDTSEQHVLEGGAVRIFTGAKMPKGADTVIPQEVILREEDTGSIQYSEDKIRTGSNVRLKGSQCKQGELILKAGTLIRAGVIGLLASVGIQEVEVYKRPSVTCIITGNELQEAGSDLQEGQIYNSNGPMLEALLKESGITKFSTVKVADDKAALQQAIDTALESRDFLILSGGISVGEYDFVKQCLEQAGVEELFYKVRQRPGKPMFAGRKLAKWIFALPGNPASVQSCFQQYVRPSLLAFMGHQQVFEPSIHLPLVADFKKKPGFTFFVKAFVGSGQVEVLSGQQSFNLLDFRQANCLAELEEEQELIPAGTLVPVYWI